MSGRGGVCLTIADCFQSKSSDDETLAHLRSEDIANLLDRNNPVDGLLLRPEDSQITASSLALAIRSFCGKIETSSPYHTPLVLLFALCTSTLFKVRPEHVLFVLHASTMAREDIEQTEKNVHVSMTETLRELFGVVSGSCVEIEAPTPSSEIVSAFLESRWNASKKPLSVYESIRESMHFLQSNSPDLDFVPTRFLSPPLSLSFPHSLPPFQSQHLFHGLVGLEKKFKP